MEEYLKPFTDPAFLLYIQAVDYAAKLGLMYLFGKRKVAGGINYRTEEERKMVGNWKWFPLPLDHIYAGLKLWKISKSLRSRSGA